ncbi:MAG TPA: chromate transporter [Stellaceae bacterium]|jgi:chromate transporter|nr:chromate transporter [Stellaceae bacterium]
MSRPADHQQPEPARIGLAAICAAFFLIGATSFGGGSAGWIHREIVVRRRWIDDAEFLATLALGQAMPGANGIKTAALIGDRLHGAAGATLAVLALLSGPFAIVLALGAAYARVGGTPLLHAVLDGIAAAAIGLTFATGLRGLAHGAPGVLPTALAATTVLCVGILRWPMVPVVLVLAPVSVALALLRVRSV